MYSVLFRNFPNALTCCNLISGCIAVKFALEGNPRLAFLFIIIGAVFDFFDGFAARKLKVSSPIGKELDSLADVITFGLAPSAMVFDMANALFWGSAACSVNAALLASPAAVYAIIFMVFATSALLVSEIPMFALKFKNFTFKDNKVRYVFLVVSLAFIIAFGIGGFAVEILWYLMLSLLTEKR